MNALWTFLNEIKEHRIALILWFLSILSTWYISTYFASKEIEQYLIREIPVFEIATDVYLEMGKLSEAIEASLHSLKRREIELQKNPEDISLQYGIIFNRYKIGIIYAMKELIEADYLDKGPSEELNLLSLAPIEVGKQSFNKYKELPKQLNSGELDQSQHHFEEVRRIAQSLAERRPRDLFLQRYLMRIYMAIEFLNYMESGKLDQDAEGLKKSKKIKEKLGGNEATLVEDEYFLSGLEFLSTSQKTDEK